MCEMFPFATLVTASTKPIVDADLLVCGYSVGYAWCISRVVACVEMWSRVCGGIVVVVCFVVVVVV